ncbi:MAG: hypothetical protein KDA93_04065 [Planctomycetaceae bacterium]|nr:hypothetical protein [Planctomycetaceae bacterium]
MSDPTVPESRAYRHVQCQTETVVGEESFVVASNPMSSMEQTFCSTCQMMFPIAEFEWVDTGETIADYYARHSADATDMQRLLCSKKCMVAIALLGALLGAIAFYLLVKDDDFTTQAFVIFAGLAVGGVIGLQVFLKVFEGPITRKVCGVSDTRLLK